MNLFIIFGEHRCQLTLTFSNVAGSTHARTHAGGFIYARTRTNAQPIYIYDVSGLDDTATGYAGLEPARREG